MRGELQGPAASPQYQPQYRYLRAQLNDFPPAYLVLGFIDPHPDGPTETWYSANGEILVLRDGRLLATTGLATDWSQVQYTPWPRWDEVGERPLMFTRTRDERPSYRFGIQEQLSLQQEPSATAHPTPAAPIDTPHWLVERTPQLPPAWYALSPSGGQLRWAYTYQCLKPGFCLSLQPWPPQANTP